MKTDAVRMFEDILSEVRFLERGKKSVIKALSINCYLEMSDSFKRRFPRRAIPLNFNYNENPELRDIERRWVKLSDEVIGNIDEVIDDKKGVLSVIAEDIEVPRSNRFRLYKTIDSSVYERMGPDGDKHAEAAAKLYAQKPEKAGLETRIRSVRRRVKTVPDSPEDRKFVKFYQVYVKTTQLGIDMLEFKSYIKGKWSVGR